MDIPTCEAFRADLARYIPQGKAADRVPVRDKSFAAGSCSVAGTFTFPGAPSGRIRVTYGRDTDLLYGPGTADEAAVNEARREVRGTCHEQPTPIDGPYQYAESCGDLIWETSGIADKGTYLSVEVVVIDNGGARVVQLRDPIRTAARAAAVSMFARLNP